MTAAHCDTLAATRPLEAVGIDRAQAEAIAAAIRGGQGELVTRTDLVGHIAALKADMFKVAIGIVAANTAVTVGLTVGLLQVLGG